MSSKRRRLVKAGALTGGALVVAGGAAAAAGKVLLRSDRRRRGPEGLRMPEDLRHHVIGGSDGARLHAVERGSGRPLVMLHGVTLSCRTWCYQLHELAEDHRLLALDLRGHGESVPGGRGATIEAMAADLVEWLEALDLHDVVLVGHSMGSMVSLKALVEYPRRTAERVAGLVIVGGTAGVEVPVFGWPYIAGLVTAFGERGLEVFSRRRLPTLPAGDLGYLISRIGLGSRPAPEHVELTLEMMRAMDSGHMAEILPGLLAFDEWEAVSSLRLPMLVMVGDKDRLTPPAYARRLIRTVAGSALVTYPGAGHMLMLERHQQVSFEIASFASPLQGTTAAASAL